MKNLVMRSGILGVVFCTYLQGCGSSRNGNGGEDNFEGGAATAGGATGEGYGGQRTESGGEAGAAGAGAENTAGASSDFPESASSCPLYDPEDTGKNAPTRLHPPDRFEVYLLGVIAGMVYFVEGPELKRISSSGGAAEIVGSVGVSWVRLVGMSDVIWVEPSAVGTQRIVRAAFAELSDTRVIVEDTPWVANLVLDEANVYWSTADPYNVYRAPLTGGAPELLVPGAQPTGAIVHEGYYYWIDFVSDRLERISLGGGAREQLAPVLFGGPMAAGGGSIYWGDPIVGSLEKWSPEAGRLRLALANDPTQLQLVGDTLYWSEGLLSSGVLSIGIGGKNRQGILCGLRPRTSILVTDDHLLVGGGSGLIRLDR